MILVEFTLDHPILQATLARVPDIELTWEQSFTTPDGVMQMVVWVAVDAFDALDTALREDPSVANASVITRVGDRRLYRLDLAEESRATSIMPLLVELGAVHERLSASHDGWRNRVRFPDRAALERLVRFCRDRDIELTLDRLFEPANRFDAEPLELTTVQRETLIEALESGYLEIPRACSLAELGDRLGVSESAASERFRRAVARLIEQAGPRARTD